MARPKIEINWKIVDQYLVAGATGTEVAAVLGIHPETLYNKCKKEHKYGIEREQLLSLNHNLIDMRERILYQLYYTLEK